MLPEHAGTSAQRDQQTVLSLGASRDLCPYRSSYIGLHHVAMNHDLSSRPQEPALAVPQRPHRIALLAATLLGGLAALIVCGWALGMFVVPHLQGFDGRVGTAIVAQDQRMVNTMQAVSFLGSGPVIAIVGVAVALGLLRRRDVWSVVFIGVSAIGATALSSIVKLLVDRPRPPIEHFVVEGASFPSGHATESIAFYGALAAVVWRSPAAAWLRVTTVVIAVVLVSAIATSRLVLGVHYVSDVIAGLVLGGLWLALCVSSTARFERHSID